MTLSSALEAIEAVITDAAALTIDHTNSFTQFYISSPQLDYFPPHSCEYNMFTYNHLKFTQPIRYRHYYFCLDRWLWKGIYFLDRFNHIIIQHLKP